MLWGVESSGSLPPALLSRPPSLAGCHPPQAGRASEAGGRACQLPAVGMKARWGGLWGDSCVLHPGLLFRAD